MRSIIQDNNEPISHPKCHLQCAFSEDFQTSECLNLEAEVISSLNRMKQVGHGISVVIVLINLHKYISEETLRLISALPGDYQFGEDHEADFWKYVFIVFKLSAGLDPADFIDKHGAACDRFREIFDKMEKRHTWITDDMTRDECVNRILGVCQSIKQRNEGKVTAYMSGGDKAYFQRAIFKERWEIKYARKISDEEFTRMIEKMNL